MVRSFLLLTDPAKHNEKFFFFLLLHYSAIKTNKKSISKTLSNSSLFFNNSIAISLPLIKYQYFKLVGK